MPSRFHLEYLDPPVALQKHILTLFHFTWDEPIIDERHPGAMSQFVLFPKGTGHIDFETRRDAISGSSHMISGFSSAVRYRMEGPWHAIGASLSPYGWAALTQSSAKNYRDRFVPAPELMGSAAEEFAAETNSQYLDGSLSGSDAARLVGDWIGSAIGDIQQAHEQLIAAVISWLGGSLNPDLDGLFSELRYSRRQSERLIERYFGFTPAKLARRHRAYRAAAFLSQPSLNSAAEAEIADAFYDQPHMVREIRHFCGHTPARLGGSGETLFQAMLRMKNFDRLQKGLPGS